MLYRLADLKHQHAAAIGAGRLRRSDRAGFARQMPGPRTPRRRLGRHCSIGQSLLQQRGILGPFGFEIFQLQF